MNETNANVGVMEAKSSHPLRSSSPSTQPTASMKESRFRSWLSRSWPTMLVLAMLGGIAYLGHHTGWSVPKFSELFSVAPTQKDDWCREHSVPESICVECNESLMPTASSTWCRRHGVHNCPFEHPEIAQVKETPAVGSSDLERAQRALDLKDRPENSSKCKLHLRRLQVASQEVLDKMGVEVAPVWQGAIVETIQASGEITFAQPSVAPHYTPVAGRVVQVTPKGQLGEHVRKGDVLALIDAIEIGKSKAELLQALAQVELRTKTWENLKALGPGVIADVRFREAETAQREAQIRFVAAQQALLNLGLSVQFQELQGLSPDELGRRIQFLGLPRELVKDLEPSLTTSNLLAIRATRDGTVTAVRVVPGEIVDATKTLFMIADTNPMWLVLNVRNEDVKYLRGKNGNVPRQKVLFRPDGTSEEIEARLTWISKAVDEKTRTLQVRADLPNPDGKLLASTFGMGKIILREEDKAMLVPSEAVHWEGDCHVVFVRDKSFLETGAPKVFHVRTVRPGVKQGPDTEIIAGLLPGEVVATRNSASLRAELLKNRLGEG